jgi:hypothetical protein
MVCLLLIFAFSFVFAECGDGVCDEGEDINCSEDCDEEELEDAFDEEDFDDPSFYVSIEPPEGTGLLEDAAQNEGASGMRVVIVWIAVIVILGVGGFLAYRLIKDGGFTSSASSGISDPATPSQDVATEYPSA